MDFIKQACYPPPVSRTREEKHDRNRADRVDVVVQKEEGRSNVFLLHHHPEVSYFMDKHQKVVVIQDLWIGEDGCFLCDAI